MRAAGVALPPTVRPGTRAEVIFGAALYLAGGLWVILLALMFWRARPFKRHAQGVTATAIVWAGKSSTKPPMLKYAAAAASATAVA